MDRFIPCSWKPATPVMGPRSPPAGRRLMERQAVGGGFGSLQLPRSHAYWRRRRRHGLMRRALCCCWCCSWSGRGMWVRWGAGRRDVAVFLVACRRVVVVVQLTNSRGQLRVSRWRSHTRRPCLSAPFLCICCHTNVTVAQKRCATFVRSMLAIKQNIKLSCSGEKARWCAFRWSLVAV